MKTQGLKWLGLLVVLTAGFLVVTPSAFAARSSGYSATCKDGTSWSGKTKRGACRGHKGVKSWSSEGGSRAAKESHTKASHKRQSRHSKKSEEGSAAGGSHEESVSTRHERKSRHSKKSEKVSAASTKHEESASTNRSKHARKEETAASMSGAASATCKDGTPWSGKSKRGACRGHKGVASWGGSAAGASPQAAAEPARASERIASHRTETRTASASGSLGAPAPGGGNGKVWVNTGSKTYHCPGTKWYGTTKQGKYMTEAQAKAQGYHADHGRACSR